MCQCGIKGDVVRDAEGLERRSCCGEAASDAAWAADERERADVFGEVISSYMRKQAIEDGVLVDLSEWAGTGPNGMIGGYLVPVAVTAAVFADIRAIPRSMAGYQDVRGRAHDLLWMSMFAARRIQRDVEREGRQLPQFALFQVKMGVKGERKQLRVYNLAMGYGDDGRTCVTIMQRGED